jgi:hypothetical protein
MMRTSDSRSSSFSFSFFFSKSDAFVVAVKAICFPFGDQASDSTDFGIDVSARGSPPLIDSR